MCGMCLQTSGVAKGWKIFYMQESIHRALENCPGAPLGSVPKADLMAMI